MPAGRTGPALRTARQERAQQRVKRMTERSEAFAHAHGESSTLRTDHRPRRRFQVECKHLTRSRSLPSQERRHRRRLALSHSSSAGAVSLRLQRLLTSRRPSLPMAFVARRARQIQTSATTIWCESAGRSRVPGEAANRARQRGAIDGPERRHAFSMRHADASSLRGEGGQTR